MWNRLRFRPGGSSGKEISKDEKDDSLLSEKEDLRFPVYNALAGGISSLD